MPLLANRGLLLGAKDRLYSACVLSVMLYGKETWPVKEEDVNRLERNDVTMVRWMCKVMAEDMIFADEPRTRLKLKSRREFLQDRREQWFGYLERMRDGTWSSKCRTFKFSGSFPRGQSRKT